MSKKRKTNINSTAALSRLITDKITGEYPENNGYQRDFVEFVTKILINAIGFSLIFCVGFFFLKFEEGVIINIIMIVMLAASTIFYKTKIKLSAINNIHLSICGVGIFLVIVYSGGLTSPILPWLLTIPFIASFLLKRIYSWIWISITVLILTFLSYSYQINLTLQNKLDIALNYHVFYIINLFMLFGFALLINNGWSAYFKKDKSKLEREAVYITNDEIDYFILNWNFIKSKIGGKFHEIINYLDQLDFLTPHEKKFALLAYLKIDPDLLAEKLNVSKRTIETNFYRVRKKLKHHKIDYRSIKKVALN